MTIFRYRHVSEWPRVYDGLRHGIEAIVHRHHDPDAGEPPAAPVEGSTVLLQAGDEIETPTALDHPHLQPVNSAAVKAAAGKPTESTDSGSTPNQDAAGSGDPDPSGESK
jgi:hypothetical protein